jgi:DNA polymerase
MLSAIQMKREAAYICNALKCKTPHSREPKKEELTACRHYLLEQIEIVSPKIILSFGRFAAAELLGVDTDFDELRKANFSSQKNILKINKQIIPIIVTYHPDVLILHPELKRPNWEDMKIFRDMCSRIGLRLV